MGFLLFTPRISPFVVDILSGLPTNSLVAGPLGVCKKLTDPPNPTQLAELGKFLGFGGLGWVGLQNSFFIAGWVGSGL